MQFVQLSPPEPCLQLRHGASCPTCGIGLQVTVRHAQPFAVSFSPTVLSVRCVFNVYTLPLTCPDLAKSKKTISFRFRMCLDL
jgi:hypothetical protein